MATTTSGPRPLPRPADGGAWIIDLDGVVWLAGVPIPGSGDAVSRLRGEGARVLFASNNSVPRIAELVDQLAAAGVAASPEEIVTSAQAAAAMVEPGARVFVVAGDGVAEALSARGVAVVDEHDADTVVVGMTRRFDFDLLARATRAIRDGARFIGTNEDATYPTPDGLLPGAGSLLAAVATASGRAPEVAGKPHEPLARLIRRRQPRPAVMVGDRPSTDGALARRLGVPFALVLSGVTGRGGPPPDPAPDHVGDDLLSVVQAASG